MRHKVLSDDPFTPLRRTWGTPIHQLCLDQNRRFIIWGSGVLGKKIAHRFIKDKMQDFILGFHDSFANGPVVVVGNYEFPLITTDVALSKDNSADALLILASESALVSMEKICLERGMKKNIDYITYRSINRPEAAINLGVEKSDGYIEHSGNGIAMMRSDFKSTAEFLKNVPELFGIELGGNTDASTCQYIEEAITECKQIAPTSVIFSSLEWVSVKKILEVNPLQAVLVLDRSNWRSLDFMSLFIAGRTDCQLGINIGIQSKNRYI